MAEAAGTLWRPCSPWGGVARPGRYGATAGAPGLHVAPRDRLGLATIVAANGREGALAGRLAAFGGLPEPGKACMSGERGLVWSAPGQWLAVAEDPRALAGLAEDLRGLAAVTEQSGSRAVLRLTGPRARDTLSKGVAVDLHPRAFEPGDAAVTVIAHVGAQLWQRDAAPTYDLAVPRSFAVSVWTWLDGAAAEFGYVVAAG
ncbi:sarcosine oxidase subunit gamma [Methylobacterium oryzihabitans]|uniref:Sarcosine oxidase subunit gamma n=1 Tax=Methylobacterium oryzihabitans TaxID=2499852 RepID=A0A3S2YWX0_9HYPH|nr:sarcosine oxidase subunit gamma family protein [Methylobacterium oryzihabitans]RVU21222.1 sarcosine oxidase subunit gamma [Methylobacterium oryzihabitans]